MVQFSTNREKRLWMWSVLVAFTIFLSLFLGRPLQHQLRDQNVQAIFFVMGMLLVGTTILIHGIRIKPKRFELTVLVGIIAIYFMLFFRLGAPERSHLIEYSILAIFIHSALIERTNSHPMNKCKVAFIAFLITFFVGFLDEFFQFFLPNRVFDIEDIVFNSMVSFFAIVVSLILNWIRNRLASNVTKGQDL